MREPCRIVTLADIGDAAALTSLAESIFGKRDRPPGWFARKLRRECVSPACSMVAITPDGAPDDPAAWLGYVLVGMPRSLGFRARTAGTGVLPIARRLGIASALLDRAAAAVGQTGRVRLQLLADPTLEPLYRRLRFAFVQGVVTLIRPSQGRDGAPLPPPRPWRAIEDGTPLRSVAAWMPEAWAGTEPALRHTVRTEDAAAHISVEGRALVVHRLCGPTAAPTERIAGALLRALPAGHPVVLPLLPEVSPITSALTDAGWHPAQRGKLLSRTVASK